MNYYGCLVQFANTIALSICSFEMPTRSKSPLSIFHLLARYTTSAWVISHVPIGSILIVRRERPGFTSCRVYVLAERHCQPRFLGLPVTPVDESTNSFLVY